MSPFRIPVIPPRLLEIRCVSCRAWFQFYWGMSPACPNCGVIDFVIASDVLDGRYDPRPEPKEKYL